LSYFCRKGSKTRRNITTKPPQAVYVPGKPGEDREDKIIRVISEICVKGKESFDADYAD